MAVTPPEFIQEAETAWNTETSPKSAGPATVQVGDVLVQVGGAENNTVTAIVPTGGPSWASQQIAAGSSEFSFATAYTATVVSGTPLTVTLTRSGAGAPHWGGNVLTFRKSGGVGKSAKAEAKGAPSLALTTESDNSAIVVIIVDWQAQSGARTWRTVNGTTPTAGNLLERTYFQDGSRYTVYAAYYPDVGAKGAKTVGLTAPTGQNYSIVAVEVKGKEEGGKALELELTDSAAFSESRGAGAASARAEVLALAETLSRAPSLGQADLLALADTLVRAFGLSQADAIAAADALTRRAELGKAETITLEDLLVSAWVAKRELGEGFAVADADTYSLAKVLAEGAALGDMAGLGISTAMPDQVGLLDFLELALRRVVEDAIGLSESAARALGLTFADTVALLDQVEGTGAAGAALEDVLKVGEQRQLAVAHLEADSAVLADSHAKSAGRVGIDAVDLVDAVGASVGRVEVDAVALGDSLAKSSTHAEADTIAFNESIGKRISASISDAVTLAERLVKQAVKFIAELFGLFESVEVDDGEGPDPPVYLALFDAAVTASAVSDQPATYLSLTNRPATYLILEDEPHV